MIQLGKIQKLHILKFTDFGAYLGENDDEKILLPKSRYLRTQSLVQCFQYLCIEIQRID